MDIAASKTIKNKLKRTWFPFFSRFGKLTQVQIDTIPYVLSGINVVVESPTASGKTEAIVVPVIEDIGFLDKNRLAVLYIVPTRALANDIFLRLEQPLTQLGLDVTFKHGDNAQLPKKTPHFLITTPESLDSLICRQPKLLSYIKHVILDEIHLLDNTYRGDQLRVLLKRLEALQKHHKAMIHLLSATIGDSQGLGTRYTYDFKTVTVKGQRKINLSYVKNYNELIELAKNNKWHKILCFTNSRKLVESSISEIKKLWKPYPVVAHHGNLSKREREGAEKIMKNYEIAICISTSTLEIGIDIGNIDAVVFLEPPPSISAFLQRLGRGNRRKNLTQGVALVANDTDQKNYNEMLNIAQSGNLQISNYRSDVSVAVQQMYSILFQNKNGQTKEYIYKFINLICDKNDFIQILEHLVEKGKIEKIGNRYYASTKLMDIAEKGIIHSNILDSRDRQVIEMSTGNKLGTISGFPGEVFLLAGRAWKVFNSNIKSIYVKRYTGPANPVRFIPHSNTGAYFSDLPLEIQKRELDLLDKKI